jgi:hypothetical protein
MSVSDIQARTGAIAHIVVAQFAPHELEAFEPTAEAFFHDPGQVRRSIQDGAPELSIGVAEAAVLLTPTILAISYEVVRFVLEPVKASLAEAIRELVGRLLGQVKPPTATDPAQERYRAARARGLEVARQLRVKPESAAIIVDAIIAQLVTQSAGPGTPPTPETAKGQP